MYHQLTFHSDVSLENFKPGEDLFAQLLKFGAPSLATKPAFACTMRTSKFDPKEKFDLLDGLVSFFEHNNHPEVTFGGIKELSFRCLLSGNGIEMSILKSDGDVWHVIVLTQPGIYAGAAAGTVEAYLKAHNAGIILSGLNKEDQKEAIEVYTARLMNTLFVFDFKA